MGPPTRTRTRSKTSTRPSNMKARPLGNLSYSRIAIHRRAEGFPDAPVAGGFFQQALGVKLQSDEECKFRIVVSLDQPILRMCHRLEPRGKTPHSFIEGVI